MDTIKGHRKQFQFENIKEWCRENSNFILLVIMIIIGAMLSENFLTVNNFMNILRRVCINGIMAVGFTIVLLSDGFDLSIGATLSLCAVLVLGLQDTLGMPISIIAALLVGTGIGALNGFLMKLTKGGQGEAFLITLGTQLVVSSIALTYTNGYDIVGVSEDWYLQIGQGNILGFFPIATLIWFGIMLIAQLLIKKTRQGRSLLISGGNKHAAYLSGIKVNNYKFTAFVIAGLCAAIAAIILTSRTTAASPRSGDGADFDAAIAAIIGGNSVLGGRGGMVQVLIGVLIYGLISNILNLLGVDAVVQYIFKGCILALAIGLDQLKRR